MRASKRVATGVPRYTPRCNSGGSRKRSSRDLPACKRVGCTRLVGSTSKRIPAPAAITLLRPRSVRTSQSGGALGGWASLPLADTAMGAASSACRSCS